MTTAPATKSSGARTLPELVRARVIHQRLLPVRHRVRFRGYLWLVDLSAVPRPHWYASFSARDHFGGEAGSIEEALAVFLRQHGEEITGVAQVLMLTNARVAGHVFNPLTTYFGVTPQGDLRWVVLEIHNTYGERHAHLIRPDERGRCRVPKEFYVSPFFPVRGEYAVVVRLDPQRVTVSISLWDNDTKLFSAALMGDRRPAGPRQVLAALVTTPLITHQVSASIRLHGIWLWLRRLPVQARPQHTPPKGFR